jgi:ATP-dependent DNA ligase
MHALLSQVCMLTALQIVRQAEGDFFIETKYDGDRIQIHKVGRRYALCLCELKRM